MKTNTMEAATTMTTTFLKDMNEQVEITRNFLKLVPEDKFDWAPHEKSMKMINLASHIAELPGWAKMAIETEELDFEAAPYTPVKIVKTSELSEILEKAYEGSKSALENASDEDLGKTWTLRSGNHIHSESSKAEVIRMALNQIVHHRAQLGVYFRLLGIPVPQSFGPTADNNDF